MEGRKGRQYSQSPTLSAKGDAFPIGRSVQLTNITECPGLMPGRQAGIGDDDLLVLPSSLQGLRKPLPVHI